MENLYKANGLGNYRLRNTDDLLKTHGIDYKAVNGFDGLTDENKSMYETFIIKFLNGLGLDSRMELKPKAIYRVEHIKYFVKEKPTDECNMWAGEKVSSIDKHGNKKLLHKHIDKEYKNLPISKTSTEYYLRVEYTHGISKNGKPINEWLHVLKDGTEWY